MIDFKKDIENYYRLEIETIEKIDKDELNKVLNELVDCFDRGGTIYAFGNGGSAATASHMVCDFNKGICSELEKRFNFVCLNDNTPIMMAIANDTSFDDIFKYQLEKKLSKDDVIIAISGSGNSKNIMKAAVYAKEIGCKVIAMTGYDGGRLDQLSDLHLHAPVNDIQVAEDIHMSFDHMMMQILWKYLMSREGKQAIYVQNQ